MANDNSIGALMGQLDDDSGRLPPAVKLQVGGAVAGRLLRVIEAANKYGSGTVSVAVIEDTSGQVRSLWLGPTVLRRAWEKLRPEIGDAVAVKRLDDDPRGYKMFEVAAQRGES